MAEFVEKRLEEQIPELEEMERTGLISREETKIIVAKRRHLEYKVSSVTSCKSDFLAAINYNALLLGLLNLRRKVTTAYQEMTEKHAGLLSVWIDWANFEMTFRKDFQHAREILIFKAAQQHKNNPILKRELLRFELLYMEYLFQKHMLNDQGHGDMQVAEKEKPVFSGQGVVLVYTRSVESHPSFDFARQLYYIVNNFPIGKFLKEDIYRDIILRFATVPELIFLKAERKALKLRTYELDEDIVAEPFNLDMHKEINPEGLEKFMIPYFLYTECKRQEKNVVQLLPITKTDRENLLRRYFRAVNMYMDSMKDDDSRFQKCIVLYIEMLFAFLYHCWGCSVSRDVVAREIHQMFSQHYDILRPEHMLQWGLLIYRLPHVTDNVEGCSSDRESLWTDTTILETALKLHPDSQPTIVRYFQHLVSNPSVTNVILIDKFKKHKDKLSSSWLHLAHHTICTGLRTVVNPVKRDKRSSRLCEDKIISFLYSRDTCQTDSTMIVNARLTMLWSCYRNLGLEAARAIYLKYADWPPVSDEFHASMCLMELNGEPMKCQEDIKPCEEFVLDKVGACETIVVENTKSQQPEDASEDLDTSSTPPGLSTEKHKPDIKRIRKIIEGTLLQNGGKHHDIWLAFYHIEDRHGNLENCGGIFRRGELAMDAWSLQAYHEMQFDIRNERFQSSEEVEKGKKQISAAVRTRVPKIPFLLRSLTPGYFPNNEHGYPQREVLFSDMTELERFCTTEPTSPKGIGVTWHDVLTIVLKGNVVRPRLPPSRCSKVQSICEEESVTKKSALNVLASVVEKQCPSKEESVEEQLKEYKLENLSSLLTTFDNHFKVKDEKFEGSDRLQIEQDEENEDTLTLLRRQKLHCPVSARDNLDSMISRSATLKAEFLKQNSVEEPKSRTQAKKLARKLRAETAGKGWDYMKAPEMTDAVRNDIELLKMRGIINPKQKFKTSHMKETPKYFQVGTYVDNPTDFYNRTTRKNRKRTITEQILNDHEAVSFQKRKYTALVAKREANRFNKKKKTSSSDYIPVKM